MSQRDRAEKKTKQRHGSGAWHASKAAEKAQRATVKAAKRARRRLDEAIIEGELADVPMKKVAKFYVADSFFLRSRNLLVLAGDVLEAGSECRNVSRHSTASWRSSWPSRLSARR